MSFSTSTSGRDPDAVDAWTIIGVEEARAKTTAWVEKCERSVETDGQITIKLYQTSRAGGRMGVYNTTHVHGDVPPAELAKDIVEAAVEDAEKQPSGKTRYVVAADGIATSVVFTLQTPVADIDDEDDDELMDPDGLELPNKRGREAMFMRHTEVLLKEAVNASRMGRRDLLLENKDLRGQVGVLTRQIMDQVRVFQEVQNMQIARDMSFEKVKREENRKDQAVAMFGNVVSTFGPGLAQKYLGTSTMMPRPPPPQGQGGSGPPPQNGNGGYQGPPPAGGGYQGFPQQSPPSPQSQQAYAEPPASVVDEGAREVERTMTALFQSMDLDQLRAVASQLRPDQLGLLASVHELIKSRMQAAEEAEAAAAQARNVQGRPAAALHGEVAQGMQHGYRQDVVPPAQGDSTLQDSTSPSSFQGFMPSAPP